MSPQTSFLYSQVSFLSPLQTVAGPAADHSSPGPGRIRRPGRLCKIIIPCAPSSLPFPLSTDAHRLPLTLHVIERRARVFLPAELDRYASCWCTRNPSPSTACACAGAIVGRRGSPSVLCCPTFGCRLGVYQVVRGTEPRRVVSICWLLNTFLLPIHYGFQGIL